MSGAGLPRPVGIRGSSPRTRWAIGKALKRWILSDVFSLKFFACEDVARARWRFGARFRVLRRRGTPGRG